MGLCAGDDTRRWQHRPVAAATAGIRTHRLRDALCILKMTARIIFNIFAFLCQA